MSVRPRFTLWRGQLTPMQTIPKPVKEYLMVSFLLYNGSNKAQDGSLVIVTSFFAFPGAGAGNGVRLCDRVIFLDCLFPFL
mmetsp:Transcript_21068/g.48656  ORF Transcript_21068/g.48656 Transcript_21068/m.48656 type:complete len:81 (+) Transcript_21068:1487-1729(+)